MPAWLFSLLAAAFVLYTDDYVIAGILPELASNLGVSVATAGQLITVFSVTVALFAPVAAVVFTKIPRRLLFSAALVVFTVANLGAAVTPSFSMLIGLRILAALAAASMTPALFAFAAMNAPPQRSGQYIAVVSLGVTGSIAAGVPIGTWISGMLDWRATFVALSLGGVVVLLALLATLPRGVGAGGTPRLSEQLATLRRLPISMGLLANAVMMTGSMMMLTYLAPFLSVTATADVDDRALAFSVSGAVGFIGIWLGGIATDRLGADRTLVLGISAFIVTMVALFATWFVRPVPVLVIIGLGAVQGGAAFWNSPAIADRLKTLAGAVAPQALALNTSGTYLGVALGGAAGGGILASIGVGALPVAAGIFATGALSLFAVAIRSGHREAATQC